MPKEIFTIENFRGMIGAVDPRNLPEGYCPYAKFVDLTAEQGSLLGLPAVTNLNDAGLAPINGRAFTLLEDGDKAVYYDIVVGEIRLLTGLKTTVAIVDPGVASAAEDIGQVCGVSDGKAVHFGLGGGGSNPPKWIGNITHGQFWTGAAYAFAAAGNNQVLSATIKSKQADGDSIVTLSNISGAAAASASATRFSPDVNYYVYGVPVYDYLQEGPIHSAPLIFGGIITPTGAYGWSDVTFRVHVKTTERSARWTGVALYRAEWPHDGERGPLRYWTTIDLTSTSNTWTASTVSGDSTYYVTYTDQDDIVGNTFTDRTGIPETLDHMDVHYGVSCTYSGFHFIGRPYVSGAGSVTTQILRSKAYRFDTFDWSNDFVTLQVKINALAAYQGRIYAFADGVTFILSVDLALEDTIQGKGAFHNESVVTTDRGMLFADSNGIYFLETGNVAINVGIDVWTNTETVAAAYEENANSFTSPAICLYDSRRDAFIILFKDSTSSYQVLVYYVDRGWTHFPRGLISAGSLCGGFHSIGGIPYISESGQLASLFTSSTRSSIEWDSPIIHMNGLQFIVYKVRVTVSKAPISNWFTYYENGGSGTSLAAGAWTSVGGGVYEATVNTDTTPPWGRVREYKITIVGDITQILRRIDLVVRRMIVK